MSGDDVETFAAPDVAALVAEVQRLRAVVAGAVTVIEWAVRYPDGYVLVFPHPTIALPAAENRIRHEGEGEVVARERTSYADFVTDWQPAALTADGGR